MGATFKKWIAALFIADVILIIWRWLSEGPKHSQIARIQELATVQILMSIVSALMYKRCTSLPANYSNIRIVIRLAVIVFLILTHSAWIFFYIYLPEDSRLALASFVCVSIYVHWGAFLVALVLWEKFFHYVFPTVRHPIFKSKPLHNASALLIAVFLTILGLISTHRKPVIHNVDVLLPNLAKDLDGFTIALVTDVHIGPTVTKSRVETVVETVNDLNADAVTIVGDLVDGFKSNLAKRAMPLTKLKSKYGVFFATGNHEYYHGNVHEWVEFFATELNLTVLRNSHQVIQCAKNDTAAEHQHEIDGEDGTICMVGVDDLITEKLFIEGHKMDADKGLKGCPTQSTVILLAHQPNAARKIIDNTKRKIHLILSGHTHGGQFYVFWPFAYWRNAFLHGLYRDSPTGTQVISKLYLSLLVLIIGDHLLKFGTRARWYCYAWLVGKRYVMDEFSHDSKSPLGPAAGLGGNLPGT